MSAEEYLKARTHSFYFIGYIVTCGLALVVVLIGFWYAYGRIDVAVDLDEAGRHQRYSIANQQLPIVADFAQPSELPDAPNDDFLASTEVHYTYEKDSGVIKVTASLPYLDQAEDKPISPISPWHGLISWDFPWLNVKVVNNTKNTLVLSALNVLLRSSTLDQRPIIFLLEKAENSLTFLNEGWGRAIQPRFIYDIEPFAACTTPFSVKGDFTEKHADDDLQLDVKEHVSAELLAPVCSAKISRICIAGRSCRHLPSSLDGKLSCMDQAQASTCDRYTPSMNKFDLVALAGLQEAYTKLQASPEDVSLRRDCVSRTVCVRGNLNFAEESGNSSRIKFSSTVYIPKENFPRSGASMPVSYDYPLYLEAGRGDYQRTIPLHQEIKPGGSDYFRIQVTTLRSANFNLDMSISEISGRVVWKSPLSISIIVPRSANLKLKDGIVTRIQ